MTGSIKIIKDPDDLRVYFENAVQSLVKSEKMGKVYKFTASEFYGRGSYSLLRIDWKNGVYELNQYFFKYVKEVTFKIEDKNLDGYFKRFLINLPEFINNKIYLTGMYLEPYIGDMFERFIGEYRIHKLQNLLKII